MSLCKNCNTTPYDIAISKGEKICVNCIKKLERVFCSYCKLDFHLLEKDQGSFSPICPACKDAYRKHSHAPTVCIMCCCVSAFDGQVCYNCKRQQEKYGQAHKCSKCNHFCAFQRDPHAPLDQLQCLLCTRMRKLQERETKRRSGSKESEILSKMLRVEEDLTKLTKLEAQELINAWQRDVLHDFSQLEAHYGATIQQLTLNLADATSSTRKETTQRDIVIKTKDTEILNLKGEISDLKAKITIMEQKHRQDLDSSELEILRDRCDNLMSENARLKSQILNLRQQLNS
ncbi:hypothetical protein RCL1_004574 [Eukaryota sp. TZLM3-RCL]